MLRDFNMGVGMIAVISADDREKFLKAATALGEKATVIGEVVKGDKGVEYVG
jgi:phosphoribosylformylglycinamidine cyclo-ligase